jgi:hypothetical protein
MKAQSNTGPASRRTNRSRTRRKQSFIDRYRGMIIALAGVVLVGGVLAIAIIEATGSNDTTASAPSEALDPAVAESVTSLRIDLQRCRQRHGEQPARGDQRHRDDGRRQAGGAVRRRRVLSLLRR